MFSSISGQSPQLKTESRALFFRAAQEALAYVARHAAAPNVTISLEADSERTPMNVADDGKGSRVAIFAKRVHLASWESESGLQR